MSVTKLRRYLSANNVMRGRKDAYQSDDPISSEGSETTQSIRRTLASRIFRSRRNGSWFRLSKLERGILSLSLHLKVTFESSQLAKALASVLKRLADLGDAVYAQLVAGTRIAWSFSEAAVEWGHSGALAWRHDRSYALFLGRFMTGVKGHR
jgi:hypothetical protein